MLDPLNPVYLDGPWADGQIHTVPYRQAMRNGWQVPAPVTPLLAPSVDPLNYEVELVHYSFHRVMMFGRIVIVAKESRKGAPSDTELFAALLTHQARSAVLPS